MCMLYVYAYITCVCLYCMCMLQHVYALCVCLHYMCMIILYAYAATYVSINTYISLSISLSICLSLIMRISHLMPITQYVYHSTHAYHSACVSLSICISLNMCITQYMHIAQYMYQTTHTYHSTYTKSIHYISHSTVIAFISWSSMKKCVWLYLSLKIISRSNQLISSHPSIITSVFIQFKHKYQPIFITHRIITSSDSYHHTPSSLYIKSTNRDSYRSSHKHRVFNLFHIVLQSSNQQIVIKASRHSINNTSNQKRVIIYK